MQLRYLFALGFIAWTLAGAGLSASAQSVYVPPYVRWQAAWDRGQFDRAHVILGTVASFQPYRLEIARRDGVVQTIDLKHGTAILPTGETPATNQRVAILGYYSNGTFIANRVILRD
jgi:hypothetical protein